MHARGRRPSGRLTVLAAVLLISTTGCSDSGQNAPAPAEPPSTAVAPATTTALDTAVASTTTASLASTSPSQAVARYDPNLTRDDVDCSREAMEGDGEDLGFFTAHYVVDGILGQVCFGEEDPALFTSWDLLATIIPPGELGPLAILAGFDAPEADTLGSVNPIGDFEGASFQMSVNLPAAEPTDPEFFLTVAHEVSHILAGQVEQLDRLSGPDECDTFYNGEGCARPGSYLDDWVAAFWTDDELASLDVASDDPDAAELRCDRSPGFLGAYAATNPDEDFAETFSAFVFQVAVDTPQLEEKIAFFEAHPELVEIRDRAEAAGLEGLPNQFDVCGAAG